MEIKDKTERSLHSIKSCRSPSIGPQNPEFGASTPHFRQGIL
jgi:hypothetical protein